MMRAVTPTPMRDAVARRMGASKREVPHFYLSTEMPIEPALAHLKRVSAAAPGEPRIGLTPLLVRAAAVALREHPRLNAVWSEGQLFEADEVNVGVAVALDDGLVAPALLNCADLDLRATATGLGGLIGRARAGRLRGAEMTGATFTLSNLGMFEVDSFIAIVTPPQVAIMAVGAVGRAIRLEGADVIDHAVLTVSVSADHRALDGVDVARFIGTYKRLLEHPEDIDGR